jgi:FlaA1/EpsC-like NDP-sugar epimerase
MSGQKRIRLNMKTLTEFRSRSAAALLFLVDCAVNFISVWLTTAIVGYDGIDATGFVVLLTAQTIIFLSFGLYQEVFRHIGHKAIRKSVMAMAVYLGLAFALMGLLYRSAINVDFFYTYALTMLVGIFLSREMLMQAISIRRRPINVLIYGAGEAGQQIYRALQANNQLYAIGFLDDDKRLHGRMIDGVSVYAPQKAASLASSLEVEKIILAMPSVTAARRAEVIRGLSGLGVGILALPRLDSLLSDRVGIADIDELDINDILGRIPVTPMMDLMRQDIEERIVLVTGAGGSIGSELCRQIIKLGPKCLILLDNCEFNLYRIAGELDVKGGKAANVVPLLGSVADCDYLDVLFATWRPETVYHAAAYKHVPIVEFNIVSGAKNNVVGTYLCALAAARYRTKKFVLISTDKAVRPTNVMGATKRVAEIILQSIACYGNRVFNDLCNSQSPATVFTMVRFGNVLGSSGSVVPLFRDQIRRGGPVTVTHPKVTRYFMTIPEAAQLVLQAGAMAEGGDVFILDMGAPVLISDLAVRMIQSSGYTLKNAENPTGDIEINYTGLRPGEKLYEELLIDEAAVTTSHPLIRRSSESFPSLDKFLPKLQELFLAIDAQDPVRVNFMIGSVIENYLHDGNLVDLISCRGNQMSGAVNVNSNRRDTRDVCHKGQ